jgi:chromosome segregation ATPase
MATYIKLLLRYRECLEGLKKLYGHSQRTLASRDEEIAALSQELRGAHLKNQEAWRKIEKSELNLTEEIHSLKAELETTKEVIRSLEKSESELMDARTRLVQERSASLSLRQRLKRAEATAEAYREEAEARKRFMEDSYAVKMEVLLNTIARLEDAKERADLTERENNCMKTKLAEGDSRMKELSREMERMIKESEKERSSINSEIVSLSQTASDAETKCALLGVEVMGLKRQNEALEGTIRSLTISEKEARSLIDDLRRNATQERDALAVALEGERSTVTSLRAQVIQQKGKIEKLEEKKNQMKQQRKNLVELFKIKFKDKLESA